jgi:hypothetical protein
LGLWSLDSLHKVQYSLKASVSSLFEAKEDLIAQIRDVSSYLFLALKAKVIIVTTVMDES